MRGLRVTLVEKADLASGTSSRSTKLLHGGLRYLERGRLGLVREALREREITARLAPHLARSLPFALPTCRGRFPGPVAARAGIALYGLLAGARPLADRDFVDAERLVERFPFLERGEWTGAALFEDRATDDARLTLAIARDAARRGAIVRTRVEAVELIARDGGIRGARLLDRETGASEDLAAEVVVNATGPWADRLRALAGADDPAIRPSRGSHLVLPPLGLDRALLLSGRLPGHRVFAIPWRGATLFGTTDDDDRTDPDACRATAGDVGVLLEEARRLFPAADLGPARILSTFAGIRPLVAAGGSVRAASREHRILEERGLVSLVGGKLTTWRVMGAETARTLVRRLGRGRLDAPESAIDPLPGGTPPAAMDDPRWGTLAAEVRRHLLDLYGGEATEVARRVLRDREAAEPLVEGRPDLVAEVDVAVEEEFARRAADVIFRRLPLGHDPAVARAAASRVIDRMARRLGWDEGRRRDEAAAIARESETLAAASA